MDISHDAYVARAAICESAAIIAHEMTRPCVMFKPTVSLDGDKYCVLYGSDLMSGCAGFGDTMEAAMLDFDANWKTQKAPRAQNQDNLPTAADVRGIMASRPGPGADTILDAIARVLGEEASPSGSDRGES